MAVTTLCRRLALKKRITSSGCNLLDNAEQCHHSSGLLTNALVGPVPVTTEPQLKCICQMHC